MALRGYSYYDTPEGKNPLKKILYCTKCTTLAGTMGGLLDVLFYSQPKTTGAMVARFGSIVVPFAVAGASFATVATAANRIREKDDAINYMLGGFASGTVVGVRMRSTGVGMGCAAAFGFWGVIMWCKKHYGWTNFFNPTDPVKARDYGRWKHPMSDYTMGNKYGKYLSPHTRDGKSDFKIED